MTSHFQIRHVSGLGFRLVWTCLARGCGNRVRSSYYRTREEAEALAPKRKEARCYFHVRRNGD
jgi:hypothetical protein